MTSQDEVREEGEEEGRKEDHSRTRKRRARCETNGEKKKYVNDWVIMPDKENGRQDRERKDNPRVGLQKRP